MTTAFYSLLRRTHQSNAATEAGSLVAIFDLFSFQSFAVVMFDSFPPSIMAARGSLVIIMRDGGSGSSRR